MSVIIQKNPACKAGFSYWTCISWGKVCNSTKKCLEICKKKKKCGRLSVLYLKTICMKIDVLTILYGTIITFTTTIALLTIMLKYRSKALLELILTYKNSFNLVLHPVLIYVFVFEVSMIISDNLPSGIFSLSGTLIWVFSALFILQWQLKKRLLKEWLDEEKAKKLSGSSVSYYFWGWLLVYMAIIAVQINLIQNDKPKESSNISTQNNSYRTISKNATDLFEKKRKCNDLFESLSWKTGTWERIVEVFYSKKMDSCIVYKKEENGAFRLYDGLTNEYIIGTDMSSDAAWIASLQKFKAKAIELKSE